MNRNQQFVWIYPLGWVPVVYPVVPQAQPRAATPRTTEQLYISGRWKRRQGDVHYGSSPTQRLAWAGGPYEPWVRAVPPIREEQTYGEPPNAATGK